MQTACSLYLYLSIYASHFPLRSLSPFLSHTLTSDLARPTRRTLASPPPRSRGPAALKTSKIEPTSGGWRRRDITDSHMHRAHGCAQEERLEYGGAPRGRGGAVWVPPCFSSGSRRSSGDRLPTPTYRRLALPRFRHREAERQGELSHFGAAEALQGLEGGRDNPQGQLDETGQAFYSRAGLEERLKGRHTAPSDGGEGLVGEEEEAELVQERPELQLEGDDLGRGARVLRDRPQLPGQLPVLEALQADQATVPAHPLEPEGRQEQGDRQPGRPEPRAGRPTQDPRGD